MNAAGVIALRPAGPRALLAEVADAGHAAALAQWARRRELAGEVVPAACTVLFDDITDPAGLAADLEHWRPEESAFGSGPVIEIPVRYDGEDLEAIAQVWRLSPAEAIERHTGTEFVAAFCGFAPGFAYLTGLGGRHAVPRLATPRARLEPGSVALAGEYCGIYPTASPGGWRVIGHTDVRLWDLETDPPALLTPGTRVRFTTVAP